MHYKAQANLLFYIVAFTFLLICLSGLLGVIRLWRLGKTPTLNTDVRTSKWLGSILQASLLETQILENGVLAWVAHMMIFWGFITLLLQTLVHSILSWFVPSTSVVFQYFKSGSGLLGMALWGDFWGLVLLGGILTALFRRYVLRPATFNTISEDWIAIWFLLVLTVTGFATEAVRLAVRPSEADAAFSFAVNWLVPFISSYNLPPTVLTYMFYVHGILSLLFVAYIPFSKLRHMFASPLVYAFVTAGSRYSKETRLKRP